MKRKKVYLAMFVMLGLMLFVSLASASINCAETMTRSSPNSVSPGQSFTVTYTAVGASGTWGASIQDAISSGTFPSGSSTYKTVMLSDDGNTKQVSVIAPTLGSIVFSGDYEFGNCSIKSFPSLTVTISGNANCTANNQCASNTCVGQTCLNNCGTTIQGTKSCNNQNVTTEEGWCTFADKADIIHFGDDTCQSGTINFIIAIVLVIIVIKLFGGK